MSTQCIVQLKDAMLERAHSVDLDPEIEHLCIEDLARLCSQKIEKNEVPALCSHFRLCPNLHFVLIRPSH